MTTITEYAIKGTQAKHGDLAVLVTVDPDPEHRQNRDYAERAVENLRAWQAERGLEPDAVIVERTVTITEWEEPTQ